MKAIVQLFLLVCYQASVVRSEVSGDFNNCNQFFYKDTPPQLDRHFDDQPTRICQKYDDQYHYATLYSTSLRIPLFSAYKLPGPCNGRQADRRATWFVEPQLLPIAETMNQRNMDLAGQQTGTFKAVQAINEDYRNTGFDRGHLNPNFYQCDGSRTATFTLTNAVPQDPCFNQQSWKKMEEVAQQTMKDQCSFTGAERYFVTGVVKQRTRIPNEEHDSEGDNRSRAYNRVTIPSHMWTAACCHDTSNQGRGFSFAYIGENIADSVVETLSVSQLETKLKSNDLPADSRYETARIFTDNCNESSDKSKLVRSKVSVPMNTRVANTLDSLNKVQQSSLPLKKRKLAQAIEGLASTVRSTTGITYDLSIVYLTAFRTYLGALKGLLQPLGASAVLQPTVPKYRHDELDAHIGTAKHDTNKAGSSNRKKHKLYLFGDKQRDTNNQANAPDRDNYVIVPSLEADDSDVSAQGDRCVNSTCTVGGGDFHRWCYTDWEKTQKPCCVSNCTFRGGKHYETCFTGPNNSEEKECSTRSSTVTVSSKRCLTDHECGLHGESYYWCYVDVNKNWDHCCQPWHTCDYHDETNKWCYSGQSKKSKRKNCNY